MARASPTRTRHSILHDSDFPGGASTTYIHSKRAASQELAKPPLGDLSATAGQATAQLHAPGHNVESRAERPSQISSFQLWMRLSVPLGKPESMHFTPSPSPGGGRPSGHPIRQSPGDSAGALCFHIHQENLSSAIVADVGAGGRAPEGRMFLGQPLRIRDRPSQVGSNIDRAPNQ